MLNTDFGPNPIPDQAWFAEVKRLGHAGFMTTLTAWATVQPWPGAAVAFDRALTAGMWIAAYARPPEGWEAGVLGLGSLADKLRFVDLDVEPEPDGEHHPLFDEQVMGLVGLGQRPVIYAYAGEFVQAMGYDPGVRFATLPLHDRGIRTIASLPTGMGQKPMVPFNGWNGRWTRRKVWQCRDPYVVGGIECSLNVVDRRWL
ncbi:MAG: hypothetical protein Q8Q14_01870 [Gemmatimonadales bacterium]|nr:hypothetical protein [Gemmatimonadales bacterium]